MKYVNKFFSLYVNWFLQIETLNNKVFIKENEKTSSGFYKTQMDIYQKGKILLIFNKQQKIQQKLKKVGNRSNHLAHASLNFELEGFGIQHSEIKDNNEQVFVFFFILNFVYQFISYSLYVKRNQIKNIPTIFISHFIL